MHLSIIGFALGVGLCQWLPQLPALGWTIGAGVLTLVAIVAFQRGRSLDRRTGVEASRGVGRRVAACALAAVAGLAWAALRAHIRLADELPMELERRDVVVTGIVDELPQPLERGVRFVFRVEDATAPVPAKVLLSWYGARGDADADPPALRPGERWRLTVRLKRPHGNANPDGFDYEAWLLERGLRATGHVRTQADPVLLDAFVPGPMSLVHRVRDAVRTRFVATLGEAPYAGILVALAVGDQNAIPKEQWIVFRRTAVAHLVSISGLHVSMVALLVAAAVGWAWRRVPALTLRIPARKTATVAGLIAAGAYSLLAGLGIPTQRSLLMLAVVGFALLSGREAAGPRALAAALFIVLVVDPWAVLAAGFWLSFGAVAAIMYVAGGRGGRVAGWRAALATQLAVTLTSLPALLVLFHAFSLLSPLANAFAIPLVSFLITPLALVAIVLPFAWPLELAHALASLMMVGLEALAALPYAMWQQAAPPGVLAAAAIAGALWLLLPRGTPARGAGLLALVPMLAWTPARPSSGEFRAVVLDVGNGMAVHLQTATHDLLYDTGPAYGPESDAGERVVLPYLAAAGVGRLDRVVISHDDLDHRGGAVSVAAGIGVDGWIAERAPEPRPQAAGDTRPCRAGDRWSWDGVEIEILHPGDERPQRDNDRSCVLRIAAPGGSLLLAGDVEAAGERALLDRDGERLASDAVLVPHHGSRSSSSAAFVAASGARVALFAVGYLNQYRHPHPAVWTRWVAAGAEAWRTDSQGALRLDVSEAGLRVAAQRELEPRYWHGR